MIVSFVLWTAEVIRCLKCYPLLGLGLGLGLGAWRFSLPWSVSCLRLRRHSHFHPHPSFCNHPSPRSLAVNHYQKVNSHFLSNAVLETITQNNEQNDYLRSTVMQSTLSTIIWKTCPLFQPTEADPCLDPCFVNYRFHSPISIDVYFEHPHPLWLPLWRQFSPIPIFKRHFHTLWWMASIFGSHKIPLRPNCLPFNKPWPIHRHH